jgi:hypothetical protein
MSQLAYTHELKNDGNFVGEAGNQPGNSSLFGDYPEFYDSQTHYPQGRLPGYTKDRIRWINTFALPLGPAGNLNVGLIGNYDSPQVFNYTTAVARTAQQTAAVTAAGYKSPPTSSTVFFGGRGTGRYNSQKSVDLGLTYSLPLFGSKIAPWVKFDMINVTNEASLITYNTTIIANPASPLGAFGLPTGYLRCGVDTAATTAGCGGALFGSAVSNASYQLTRNWQAAVGVRF